MSRKVGAGAGRKGSPKGRKRGAAKGRNSTPANHAPTPPPRSRFADLEFYQPQYAGGSTAKAVKVFGPQAAHKVSGVQSPLPPALPGDAPAECRRRITPNVECRDTAAAQAGRHHWDCGYWAETDQTPF